MHLAPEIAELDEAGKLARARRLELAAVLPQLGRDERVAEKRIEGLLVPKRVHLARLDHRDAVLGDREPAALRVLAHRDVVLLRAGEVLEQAPVALRGDDPQVEAQSLLRDHGRLRLAARHDLEHPGQPDEMPGQRRGVGGRRDHVEVAERLLPAPHAARLGDVDGGRVLAQRRDDLAHDRKPDSEQAAARRRRPLPLGERLQDLGLRRRAEPGERAEALLLRRLFQPCEGGHAELPPDPGRGLRSEPRQPHERGNLVRHLGTPLRECVHLARRRRPR